jgi:hypothetical protein
MSLIEKLDGFGIVVRWVNSVVMLFALNFSDETDYILLHGSGF